MLVIPQFADPNFLTDSGIRHPDCSACFANCPPPVYLHLSWCIMLKPEARLLQLRQKLRSIDTFLQI